MRRVLPRQGIPVAWVVLATLCGCAPLLPPPPAADGARGVEVTTTYLAAYGQHFAHGQYAVVRVCVAASGAIASTRIVESSTDRNFDQLALG
jgi:hypothetical protein